ncbi:PREDICTED: uncharacterized protein At3g60930, chloroplastic-like [Brassica oleracea var. oleracea]|uniref:uncharacterized protein At3g60930, chloroplastic-like n=1 Tax=Brassica oleracea var. oleracea TaxID=109376 RepID=UPI0006A71FCE|nr:PREDICTED: uncharacterized protein At3g60930, chloroplastic-like [Brassica oleracea var. oleracea]
MRIESGLSSASVDDRMDSPQSSPSLSPSPFNARGSKSTNDNILIARRPLLRRDEGGSLRRSVRTTPVEEQSSSRAPVPQHVDEDVIDLEDDDEHDADNAPAEEVPLAGLPSLLTRRMLDGIARTCRFPRRLQMRSPNANERRWTPPPGWMCLYEAFFTHLRLWFPLPRLLTSYAAARDIALTQFTPAAMRNVVAPLVLGAEVGFDVDLRFFKELANISRNPGTPNTFYINIKSRYDILRGRVNKAHEWFQRYFFVQNDSASIADLDASLRGTWNPSPSESLVLSLSSSWFVCDFLFALFGVFLERHPISFPLPAGFSRGVEEIRELGVQQWPQFDRHRIFRSVLRISAVSLVAPRGGEPVTAEGKSSGVPPAGGFMADAIRSSALGGRESGSLKRPSEGIMVGDIHEEKRSRRDPYARVFRYDRDTPFVNEERACAEYFCLPRNAFTNIPDADDLVHAKEFKDMAHFDAHSKAHAVRLVYLYEKDLKRMRTKLEDMFAEKELRDNRIKELEVTVDGLNSAVETLKAELSASSSRDAILRSQIGDQQNTLESM